MIPIRQCSTKHSSVRVISDPGEFTLDRNINHCDVVSNLLDQSHIRHSMGCCSIVQLHSDTSRRALVQSGYARVNQVNIGRSQLPTIRELHTSRKVKGPPSELWIQYVRLQQFHGCQHGLPREIPGVRVEDADVELSRIRDRGNRVRRNNRIRGTSIWAQHARLVEA